MLTTGAAASISRALWSWPEHETPRVDFTDLGVSMDSYQGTIESLLVGVWYD